MIRLNKTLLLTAYSVQVLRPHECLRTCLRSRCAPSRAFGVSSAATLGLPSAYFYYIRSVRDNIPALPMHCSTDRRCGAGHLRLAGPPSISLTVMASSSRKMGSLFFQLRVFHLSTDRVLPFCYRARALFKMRPDPVGKVVNSTHVEPG